MEQNEGNAAASFLEYQNGMYDYGDFIDMTVERDIQPSVEEHFRQSGVFIPFITSSSGSGDAFLDICVQFLLFPRKFLFNFCAIFFRKCRDFEAARFHTCLRKFDMSSFPQKCSN